MTLDGRRDGARHASSAASVAAPLPLFYARPEDIIPLSSPTAFFEELLAGCRRAKSRVSMASLYVGTEAMEQALVAALRQRIVEHAASGNPFEVRVQTDLCRSLRHVRHAPSPPGGEGKPHAAYSSSAHLLLELLQPTDPALAHLPAAGVTVGLTLMPQQRGLLGKLLPARVIEGAGVFHMKAYVFDDCVLLSGANLSHDYFTHRQDRYMLLRSCAPFADYLHSLVRDIQLLPGSHVLLRDGEVRQLGKEGGGAGPGAQPCPPPPAVRTPQPQQRQRPDTTPVANTVDNPLQGARGGPLAEKVDVLQGAGGLPAVGPLPPGAPALDQLFLSALREVLLRYSGEERRPHTHCGDVNGPGALGAGAGIVPIRPRLQLGALGVSADEDATLALLRGIGPAPAQVAYVATGYFNLTPRYSDALLFGCDPRSSVHVLTAAPCANGFFGARGISGAIPAAYSEIERDFYGAVERAGRLHAAPLTRPSGPGIALWEYSRPGWTFHAKGLWLVRQGRGGDGEGASVTTLVGSPNFGHRSSLRDLELQVQIDADGALAPGLVRRLLEEKDALFCTGTGPPAETGTASRCTEAGGGCGGGSLLSTRSSRASAESVGLRGAAGREAGADDDSAAFAVPLPSPRGGEELELPQAAAEWGEGAAGGRFVHPVGRHLGPAADVWARPERQLAGWGWQQGLWIHVLRRILTPFF